MGNCMSQHGGLHAGSVVPLDAEANRREMSTRNGDNTEDVKWTKGALPESVQDEMPGNAKSRTSMDGRLRELEQALQKLQGQMMDTVLDNREMKAQIKALQELVGYLATVCACLCTHAR